MVGEYRIKLSNGKHASFDFLLGDKVIEFNGDKWHANPKLFNEDDYININTAIKNIPAKEIWEKDRIRHELVKEQGYEVLTIWEKEYNENPEEVKQRCLRFLKE